MNEQKLKELWQQQRLSPPVHREGQELAIHVKRMMLRFDRTIFWRDAREIGACVVVAILTGLGLMHRPSALTKLGIAVVIGSCLWIAMTLIITRRSSEAICEADSLRDRLRSEIKKVTRQIGLLRSVLWWYALPLLVGTAMMELGYHGHWAGKITVIILLAVVAWLVHQFNQRGVAKLLKLKRELEDALNSVPEFLEPDMKGKAR
jgi:Flp pilus assembly protein TadB